MLPQIENPDGSNVIGEDGRPESVRSTRATRLDVCPHASELVTVRVASIESNELSQGASI